jgi:hypothetical protein
VNEKERPEQGDGNARADEPRKRSFELLGEKLKRLEGKRSRTASRPVKRDNNDDARAMHADSNRDSVSGYGKHAKHIESINFTGVLPEADISGSEERLITEMILSLTDENKDFLRGYSMGPVCGLYLVNRISWPLLLPFALGLIPVALLGLPMWSFIVVVLICLFCPPAIALICFHVGLVLLNRPWDMELPMLIHGTEPSAAGGYIYIGAGWLVLGYVVMLGYWSRRMRWKGLRWSSFGPFQRAEDLWYGLGGLLALVIILLAVGVFALGGLDELGRWFEEFYYLNF